MEFDQGGVESAHLEGASLHQGLGLGFPQLDDSHFVEERAAFVVNGGANVHGILDGMHEALESKGVHESDVALVIEGTGPLKKEQKEKRQVCESMYFHLTMNSNY